MSDIISDGGMDPRYEYEKERRTDKDKRIAELEQINVEQGLLIAQQHNEIERLRELIKNMGTGYAVSPVATMEVE
jgi:hypothetical protein